MTDFAQSNRRDFLLDTTRGLGGVALGAMLADDGITRAAPSTSVPDGLAHIAPRAKSVIWLFMVGGASHMETFDPKPALNKYAGISIDKTPFAETLKNPSRLCRPVWNCSWAPWLLSVVHIERTIARSSTH